VLAVWRKGYGKNARGMVARCSTLAPCSIAADVANGMCAIRRLDRLGECKHCYWNIPINRQAVIAEDTIAELMARELEELLTA